MRDEGELGEFAGVAVCTDEASPFDRSASRLSLSAVPWRVDATVPLRNAAGMLLYAALTVC